jgi:hypothetical protein
VDLIDIIALKKITKYEGSFDRNYIEQFWSILSSFSQEERRQFLAFVTGMEKLMQR